MSKTLKKFAPQLVVLAVVLYWSWPALKAFLPQTGLAATAESAKAAADKDFVSVLSPKFSPPAKRNPFQLGDAKSLAAAGHGKRGGTSKDGRAVADMHDAGLVLNATCIVGQQRMAVINGHVYKEKESVPRAGEETASCILTEILPRKVLLLCDGATLQLSYLNTAATPAAKSAAGDKPGKSTK
jgi:hypothetical protein